MKLREYKHLALVALGIAVTLLVTVSLALPGHTVAAGSNSPVTMPRVNSAGALANILLANGSRVPATASGPGGCFVTSEACFFYVGADQGNITTEGANVLIQQADPKVGSHDNHSLIELSVESQDQKEIIEVGWIVVEGPHPHSELFVFHWVKDKATCINGCGYVRIKGKMAPGSKVTAGATRSYGVEFTDNRWYILYGGQKIGYFPEKLWTSKGVTFKKAGLIQVFGEVESSRTRLSQTQMGNGKLGKAKGSDFFRSVTYFHSSTKPSLTAYEPTNHQALGVYDYGSVGAARLNLGGPGYRH